MKTISATPDAQVLCWPKRLLSADDLRRHLTSQRELELLPKTVVTPLAMDELRAKGIVLTWRVSTPTKLPEEASSDSIEKSLWGYATETSDAQTESAIQGLAREGIRFTKISPTTMPPWQWAEQIATAVANQQCRGVVAFCGDPGLICCVANKVSGVRAVSVLTVNQAIRGRQAAAANLLAVEMPGRTLFEVRQILKTAATLTIACPPLLADKLRELDGHAHR